jgi:CRISPR/Cas system-associated protein Csm6
MPRQYRPNILGIEPMDTIIVLRADLDRLLEFVQKVAYSKEEELSMEDLQHEAQTILQEDGKIHW